MADSSAPSTDVTHVPVIEAEAHVIDPDAEVVEGEVVGTYQNPHMAARLGELNQRRLATLEKGQIDNGSLMAGAPMFFYCKYCGQLSDTLPENYWLSTPKEVCEACTSLIEMGWHDGQRYMDWRTADLARQTASKPELAHHCPKRP